MSEANTKTIQRTYEAFSRGDMADLIEHWTSDIVWHATGDHQLARTYETPEAILGFFGQIFELTDRTFQVSLEHCLADEAIGYALHTARGERDGRSYEWSEVLVMRFQDGKVAEIWSHMHGERPANELLA